MKLVTFTHGGKTRIGAVMAEDVVDVSGQGRNVPSEMVAFLEQVGQRFGVPRTRSNSIMRVNWAWSSASAAGGCPRTKPPR